MAVRRESVLLTLEDSGFTSGMARAAAATAVLNRELHDVDGAAPGAATGIKSVGDESDKSAAKINRSGDSINQLTGRLRLLTDAALTLGPALVPLGAGAVGGIAGMAAQFGALAGGIGVSVMALNGVGDALEAVNKYQLEPTGDNLAKVAEEFNKLGPAGAEFVVFLESISPQLREMQMLAREGFLPGLADGIDSFLSRGSQLNNIVADLAAALGDLSASAGEALGGERFDGFFDYLDAEAGPLLLEFGRSLGYVAEGFANLLVAFSPVSSDFSTGLEDMTRSFAEWSRGLQDNGGFQEFLSYVRENGPAAIDFLGSLVGALAGVVEAAAPIGQAILPVLTKMLDLFAGLAGTPVGSSLLAIAAGFVAINRAGQGIAFIGGKFDALTNSLAGVETNSGKAAAGMGRLNRAALIAGSALGALVLVSEIQEQFDGLATGVEALTGQLLDLAATQGASELSGEFSDLAYSLERLTDANAAQRFQTWVADLSGIESIDSSEVNKAREQFELLDQALTNLVTSGRPEAAEASFNGLVESLGLSGDEIDELRGLLPNYGDALAGVENDARLAGDAHVELRDDLNYTTTSLDSLQNALKSAREMWKENRKEARSVAESFVNLGDSLNDNKVSLNGWLKQLEDNARALQEFQRNAREAGRRGLDEGLVESLRNAGSEGALRMRQLANATDEQIERANKSWYKGQGAVKDFVKEVGGVKPKYITRLEAEIDAAMAEISRLKAALNIPDETVNVWVTRRTVNAGGGPGPQPVSGSADGGTVPKTGMHYADRHPYLLADGEEVISNRNGQADKHRSLLKAINAGRLADGGTAGGSRGMGPMNPLYGIGRDFISAGDMAGRLVNLTVRQLAQVGEDMERLAKGPLSKLSKAFEKATELAEDELAAVKDKLRALKDERDSIAATVEARLKTADLFTARTVSPLDLGMPEGGFTSVEQAMAWQQASIDAGNFLAGPSQSPLDILRMDLARAREEQRLIRDLKSRGLSGSALQYAIESDGGLAGASSLSQVELRQFQDLYGQRDRLAASVGMDAGNAVLGREIRQQTREVRAQREVTQAIREEARDTNRRLERLERLAEKAPKATGKAVGDEVRGEAAKGARNR